MAIYVLLQKYMIILDLLHLRVLHMHVLHMHVLHMSEH